MFVTIALDANEMSGLDLLISSHSDHSCVIHFPSQHLLISAKGRTIHSPHRRNNQLRLCVEILDRQRSYHHTP